MENKAGKRQKTHIRAAKTASDKMRATIDRPIKEAAIALRRVKLVHTVIWALFATFVLVIPFFALVGSYKKAIVFIAFVLVEVLVLAFNGWRCPLTNFAARYTEDRRDNFDIYLPEWLARNNKRIFGILYVVGILLTVARMCDIIPCLQHAVRL